MAASYLLLDLSKVPSKTWSAASKIEEWTDVMAAIEPSSCSPGSLNVLPPCPFWIQVTVCVLLPMYFAAFNYLPVILAILPFLGFSYQLCLGLLVAIISMCTMVGSFSHLCNTVLANGAEKSRLSKVSPVIQEFHLEHQYQREKLTNAYFAKKYILPTTVFTKMDKPAIICIAPHNVLPWGNTGAFSKLFGNRATVWAAAPVLFKIPLLQPILRRYGTFSANKKGILRALADGYNVGVVLDGIAGMFCAAEQGHEELYLRERKAICAVALRAGCSIIPAYAFGCNDCATVLQDPFGLLRRLSIRLDISLTPFLGRWGLPMGPPRRIPLLVAFGDPLPYPQIGDEQADIKSEVDTHHGELLDAFVAIFDTWKQAYGWTGKMTFV